MENIGLLYIWKAFDSVKRDVLRKILDLRGLLPNFVNLIHGLFTGIERAMRFSISDYSPIITPSVMHSCHIILQICMEHVRGRIRAAGLFGTVRINDLDFADDAVIFAETTEVLPEVGR